MVARKGKIPKEHERFSPREFFVTLKDAVWSLFIPVLIIGGIRLGMMTPTEAGAVAAVYALFIGIVVYRKIKWREMRLILRDSVNLTAAVILIVAASSAFGWVLTWEQTPQQVISWVMSLTENPHIFLLLLNIALLILGMFLEGTACIILLTPLLVPLVLKMGIDPVHFGIIMVLNLTIGSITPPVGTVMFTTSAVSKISVVEFVRAAWPLYLALFLVLMIVTYVPELSLYLVN